MPGLQGGPLMHVIAAKAVAFHEALSEEFDQYAEQVIRNAKALAAALTAKGYQLVSGGTDNHLLLIDLRNKGITGKQAEQVLDSVGITCNKNMVPFDTQSPFVTSGIRLGTPAITTRGMTETDMEKIADLIDYTLTHIDDTKAHQAVREEVDRLCAAYPLYPTLPRFLEAGLRILAEEGILFLEDLESFLESVRDEFRLAFGKAES